MCQFCDSCASNDDANRTIYGTNEADLLIGGSLEDYIFGKEGDDSLSGHGGNDYIFGKEGDDSILGGGGDDYLIGDSFLVDDVSSSNDTLRGGAGNDELVGGIGEDKLSGGEDNDRLFGGEDNDRLHGDFGDDYLNGEDGNDLLFGNADDDTLWGGNGISSGEDRDTLLGGDGNDELVGGLDNDVLKGGSGQDRFAFISNVSFAEANLGVDIIRDFVSGEDKIVLDRRVFQGLNNGTTLDSSQFTVVANDLDASEVDESIVYSSSTGKLFYNENGSESGFGAGGEFAILREQPNLVAEDLAIA